MIGLCRIALQHMHLAGSWCLAFVFYQDASLACCSACEIVNGKRHGGAVVTTSTAQQEVSPAEGLFCVEFASCPRVSVSSLRIKQLPSTVQKHAEATWELSIGHRNECKWLLVFLCGTAIDRQLVQGVNPTFAWRQLGLDPRARVIKTDGWTD